jgi:hypothetical protein
MTSAEAQKVVRSPKKFMDDCVSWISVCAFMIGYTKCDEANSCQSITLFFPLKQPMDARAKRRFQIS